MAIALANGFRQNLLLEVIELAGNAIGLEGLSALVAKVHFKMLVMSDNNLPRLLTDYISRDKILLELYLAGNGIADASCRHVADSLTASKSMRTLTHYQNMVADDGCIALAEGLRNSPVSELNLAHNKITHVGAEALVALLRTNHSLLTLPIDGNEGISQQHKDIIKRLCENNLRLNAVSEKSKSGIREISP